MKRIVGTTNKTSVADFYAPRKLLATVGKLGRKEGSQ